LQRVSTTSRQVGAYVRGVQLAGVWSLIEASLTQNDSKNDLMGVKSKAVIPEQEGLQESRIQGLLSSRLVLKTLSSPPQPETRGKSKDEKT